MKLAMHFLDFIIRLFFVPRFLGLSICMNNNLYHVVIRYLSALISQSFLDIGSVSRILDSIMKLCLQFCWKIENLESNERAVELEQIAEVKSGFAFSTFGA